MSEASDRVRELLVRGDNLLKGGRSEKALANFEEAWRLAMDSGLDDRVIALAKHRIDDTRALDER